MLHSVLRGGKLSTSAIQSCHGNRSGDENFHVDVVVPVKILNKLIIVYAQQQLNVDVE